MNKKERKRKKKLQIQNRKLIKRYPFLMPRSRWTDKVSKDYDYTYTELDAMESGWRKAFGIQMCEEIRQELIKFNFLYKYRIMQIKEKFGELRWYDWCVPKDSHLDDIINKYTLLSRQICYNCGAPGKVIDDGGWLVTLCPKCYNKMKERQLKFYK